jgi:hypothetical protein
LTFLVPAEAPVGDPLGRHELQRAEQRIILGDLEYAIEDLDMDQLAVGPKH